MPLKKPYIGTQISLSQLHRLGVAPILDVLQEQCGLNTIRLHADDRVRSNAHYFSKEGEEPALNLCGIPIDPKNYKDTAVMCQAYMGKLPAKVRLDLLEELRRELDSRDMRLQVRCIIGPDAARDSFAACLSRDDHGVVGKGPCWNNPHFIGFQRGVAEDLFRTSPIKVDGYLHMAEFSGPLHAAIFGGHLNTICFCEHCRKRGMEEGIDVGRAREGLVVLKRRLIQAERGERRLGFDGFFQILGDYPEITAWDAMQARAYHECPALVKGVANHCNPDADVGVHVWHAAGVSMFLKATYDPAFMAGYCDYIKPLVYHTFSGLRFSGHVKKFHKYFVPEATEEQAFAQWLGTLGMNPAEQVSWEGFANEGQLRAADYVGSNTRFWKEHLAEIAKCEGTDPVPVIPNPGWEDEFAENPPDPRETQTYAGVRAAIEAGADGIFLSRQFAADHFFGDKVEAVPSSEASKGGSMQKTEGDIGPNGLAAFGAALKDAGWR